MRIKLAAVPLDALLEVFGAVVLNLLIFFTHSWLQVLVRVEQRLNDSKTLKQTHFHEINRKGLSKTFNVSPLIPLKCMCATAKWMPSLPR